MTVAIFRKQKSQRTRLQLYSFKRCVMFFFFYFTKGTFQQQVLLIQCFNFYCLNFHLYTQTQHGKYVVGMVTSHISRYLCTIPVQPPSRCVWICTPGNSLASWRTQLLLGLEPQPRSPFFSQGECPVVTETSVQGAWWDEGVEIFFFLEETDSYRLCPFTSVGVCEQCV